jgi:purine-binding chemotaxis protein CheW
VPKAAEFIEGITNLRGEVIPVLDTRKRFELEVKESDDRTRIIIVDLGGVKTGLVVDSVREVLNLASKDISPPPEAIASGVDQQFISGIGKVDSGKRMIVLLDVEKILSREEQAHLSEVTE